MKSTIETSIYLLIIALAAGIFTSFIRLNADVNKVNEVTKYVQDYMDVHGTSSKSGTSYNLDSATVNAINDYVSKHNMTADINYDTATNNYVYYNVKINYNLDLALPKFHTSHNYTALARTAKPE